MRGEFKKSLQTVARLCGAMGAVVLLTTPFTLLVTDGLGGEVVLKIGVGIVLIAIHLLVPSDVPTATYMRHHVVKLSMRSIRLLLVLFMVVAVNIIAVKKAFEWDVTPEGLFSLSPQTLSVLDQLDTKVEIMAFYRPTESARTVVAQILARYAHRSMYLSYTLLNPEAHPKKVEQFNIRNRGTRIVVNAQGRTVIAEGFDEQNLTHAIMRAVQNKKTTVWVTQGHHEPRLDDNTARGLQQWSKALRAEGFDVQPLYLREYISAMGRLEFELGEGVLVIPGSTGPFSEPEIQGIKKILTDGGRVMLLLDPSSTTTLEAVARHWNIEPQRDIIADPTSQYIGLGWSGVLMQPSPKRHPITLQLGSPGLIKTARSLKITDTGSPKVIARPLLVTTHSAWGETDTTGGMPKYHPHETKGPLVVAAIGVQHDGHQRQLEGRLLVVGNSQWIQNRLWMQQGNSDIALNCIAWLAQQHSKITIRPRVRKRSDMALSPQSLGRLKFASLDLLPILIVAVGVGMTLLRRRL